MRLSEYSRRTSSPSCDGSHSYEWSLTRKGFMGRCLRCGHVVFRTQAASPPHWVSLQPGTKQPRSPAWRERPLRLNERGVAHLYGEGTLAVVPGHSGIGAINIDEGTLDTVLSFLVDRQGVKPLAAYPSQTPGHHHVLVPVERVSPDLPFDFADGTAGSLISSGYVKIHDLAAWQRAVRNRRGRKRWLVPGALHRNSRRASPCRPG